MSRDNGQAAHRHRRRRLKRPDGRARRAMP